MKKPQLSVVMPTYNCQKYIGRAIESILEQTFKNYEFIIIDDASTDKTLSIIRSYARKDKRIRVIRNKKNLQIARSLNKGIGYAVTDLIIRMDSDDISYPTRL